MSIFSFCATPIFVGERAAGLFCLCNVRVHQSGLAVLSAVADYLSGQIQREELHQEKEKALFYDSLTGCLNFEGYKLWVERVLRNNPERKYSLWYCDLKKFKYINDVFGFGAGNRLLRYWMNYVAADTRSGEAFCQISADHLSFLRWYDSVSELKERFDGVANALKVDVLKLDRLFFAPRGEPERQRIVVAAILSLARQLHMSTIAEGIGDEAQMEELRELGCDYVQGFVFSKPLTVREYTAWIEGKGTWK